ncbi:MAG: phosphoribosylaminoimidazolesuccinocarboxamide synthase [Bacteroidales bacterium]|nr:phosphoribosylaminoimidazolesuccinocarboxamide synthase [Bacteroidales bacterium]
MEKKKMEAKEIIYDGESVKIYSTDDSGYVIQKFTDVITAYNKIKKAVIQDKGKLNCAIASKIFGILRSGRVPTHFVERLSDTEIVCRTAKVFKVDVIVRNVIAGTMAKRLGIEEGVVPAHPIVDLCYANEELGDPFINEHHAVALGLATYDELEEMNALAIKTNSILKPYFADRGVLLVDFKMLFGRLDDGRIVLADEITPDSARLWDADTGERLDKDRFRRDLGRVGDAYREIAKRIELE